MATPQAIHVIAALADDCWQRTMDAAAAAEKEEEEVDVDLAGGASITTPGARVVPSLSGPASNAAAVAAAVIGAAAMPPSLLGCPAATSTAETAVAGDCTPPACGCCCCYGSAVGGDGIGGGVGAAADVAGAAAPASSSSSRSSSAEQYSAAAASHLALAFLLCRHHAAPLEAEAGRRLALHHARMALAGLDSAAAAAAAVTAKLPPPPPLPPGLGTQEWPHLPLKSSKRGGDNRPVAGRGGGATATAFSPGRTSHTDGAVVAVTPPSIMAVGCAERRRGVERGQVRRFTSQQLLALRCTTTAAAAAAPSWGAEGAPCWWKDLPDALRP